MLGRSNFATIGVEDNNHGGTTNRALWRLKYPDLFYRLEIDDAAAVRPRSLAGAQDTASRPCHADPKIVDAIVELLGVPPGSAIADVGAGTGNYSCALARRGTPSRRFSHRR